MQIHTASHLKKPNPTPMATTALVDIQVLATGSAVSLASSDPDIRIDDEFLTYKVDRNGDVEAVTFRFTSADPAYTTRILHVPTILGDPILDGIVTMGVPADLRLSIGLEPAVSGASTKLPLDITIKTRKPGGGDT